MRAGLDPEHGHVVEKVPADELRRDPIPVREGDEDAVCAIGIAVATACRGHDMGAREDVPALGDDEPRALSRVLFRRPVVELGVDGDDSGAPRPVDRGRIEAVSEEWLDILSRQSAFDRLRHAAAGDEDRIGRPSVDEAGSIGENDGEHTADQGGDAGDNSHDSRAHEGTVARRLGPAVLYGQARFHGETRLSGPVRARARPPAPVPGAGAV
jgi:hypothetical protein